MAAATLQDALSEKLSSDRQRGNADRETSAAESRAKLRDFAVFLRAPNPSPALAPAKVNQPSFLIGEAQGFPHATVDLKTGKNGHLSDGAARDFWKNMGAAAEAKDPASRDAATGRAASAVAQDFANKHHLPNSKDSLKAHMLHEVRAQAVFVSREIGEKLGIGPAQSSILGYSLERALEKEGFRTLVSHAVDKSADFFKSSAASAAHSTGLRHQAETTLNKSMQWLSSHGVTSETFKNALTKHAGAITGVVQLSQHPEVVARAAHVIANSPKGLAVVANMASDRELREAVGTMTLATGQSLAHVHKGVGSVAILAGSALRGDSVEDTGRHAFRAALSVLGGAAGGAAGGALSFGFGTIGGAVAGSMAGDALADKLLKMYDQHFNKGAEPEVSRVSQAELHQSKAVLADRAGDAARGAAKDAAQDRGGPSLERSYNHKPTT